MINAGFTVNHKESHLESGMERGILPTTAKAPIGKLASHIRFAIFGAMTKHAMFLSGPIGVGKTTLGRALSERIAGGFVDGDDHSNPDNPWYCSILRTSISIVQSSLAILDSKPAVVIAYPLTCVNWIYFRRKFKDCGISPVFVSLRASLRSIVDESRGRRFSVEEQNRIRTMIAEGYGTRAFSDLIVDTDTSNFAATLARLESETIRMMKSAAQWPLS